MSAPLGTPGAMDAHNAQVARERVRRLREQQGPPLTEDELRAALGLWADRFAEHIAHGGWSQISRCVYCSCGQRLYHGHLPKKPAP